MTGDWLTSGSNVNMIRTGINYNYVPRMLMKEKNIGAAVFTSIHNIAYFSNYVYCSMGRPYALVVTQDTQTSVSALVDGGQPWRR